VFALPAGSGFRLLPLQRAVTDLSSSALVSKSRSPVVIGLTAERAPLPPLGVQCHARDRPMSTAASREVSRSLQRFQVVLRYPPAANCRGPSRFDIAVDLASLRRRSKKYWLANAPSLRFFRLAFAVRAAHAARLQFTVHAGSFRGSFATVSLSRGVPLPVEQTLSRPGRIFFFMIRQRSWDLHVPFAVFPALAGPRISAVHPHMPLSCESYTRDAEEVTR
jgi:hypothetical protein